MKKENEISQKRLEELSLKALYIHCPKCGQIGKDFYCKDCDFYWKEGYIYFSNSSTNQSNEH